MSRQRKLRSAKKLVERKFFICCSGQFLENFNFSLKSFRVFDEWEKFFFLFLNFPRSSLLFKMLSMLRNFSNFPSKSHVATATSAEEEYKYEYFLKGNQIEIFYVKRRGKNQINSSYRIFIPSWGRLGDR